MPRLAIVVDDSMLIRHTVCRYFEQRGFFVESATNGAEASCRNMPAKRMVVPG